MYVMEHVRTETSKSGSSRFLDSTSETMRATALRQHAETNERAVKLASSFQRRNGGMEATHSLREQACSVSKFQGLEVTVNENHMKV